ncbi:MAG: flavodoxin-dependent (E)-4-hydroxy-3-methylbut-2-enyl-diphosphate synthase, partial [bacterium]
YRLLILKMQELGMNYPLHLGVTEAGDGEDGRIKSAVGIGALLEDGIGDTIRVSLTEDPEFEIPVAKALVRRVESLNLESLKIAISPKSKKLSNVKLNKLKLNYNPYQYERRKTDEIANFGGHNVPRVIADYSEREHVTSASLFSVGYHYSVPTDKWTITEQACDYIYVGDNVTRFEIPGTLGLIYNKSVWVNLADKTRCYPLFTFEEYLSVKTSSDQLNFLSVTLDDILRVHQSKRINKVYQFEDMLNHEYYRCDVVLIFETSKEHGMAEQRRMFMELKKRNINVPVIIKRNYKKMKDEDFQLYAAADMGALLLDGFADGVMLSYQRPQKKGCDLQLINSTSFGLLQATRMRISKTEYISCPSCGRTLFDLQETTAKIRERTDHLKGVKIGIMGCIVNGPGEMADADYGYVGTGPGKITLYKGKQVVERNIDEAEAVDSLINLIKQGGDWVDV